MPEILTPWKMFPGNSLLSMSQWKVSPPLRISPVRNTPTPPQKNPPGNFNSFKNFPLYISSSKIKLAKRK
jgi:hypothetical protein